MKVDKGNRPGGFAGRGECAFQKSLQLLNVRVDWIPVGWQGLYADMRVALRAAATHARSDVSVYGGYEEDGLLYVDTRSDDPVIRGVLRRARCRAMYTCTQCGRGRARQRLVGDNCTRTLCGSCAGRYLLHWELTQVLAGRNDSSDGTWQGQLGVRLWAAMRAAWPAQSHRLDENTPVLNTSALRPWMEHLRAHVDGELY